MPTANLYLDFQFDDGASAQSLRVLKAAIAAAPIACALLRPATDASGHHGTPPRDLVTTLQAAGIATLITGGLEAQSKLGADGIHLPWSPDVVREFKTLRRDAPQATMIGADAGRSRHDAMEIGEAGAEYLAFGIPPHVEDRAKAFERQCELIAWWSELFEIPCVAFDVASADAAHDLAAAGADFVCVRVTSADGEQETAARVRAYSEAVKKTPEPAT